MKTRITRALAALASLCAGFASADSAVAQGTASYITNVPTFVYVSLENPQFREDYRAYNLTCTATSRTMEFSDGRTTLGQYSRTISLANSSTASEVVIIPGQVLDAIRRQHLTSISFQRQFACATTQWSYTVRGGIGISSSTLEVTPSPALVATGADTLVPVHWKLTLPAGGNTAESREGTFADDQGRSYPPPVATVLRKTGRDRVEFDEALVVPANIAKSAFSRTGAALSYTRTFLISGPYPFMGATYSGTVVLQAASALQAVLARPERATVIPQTTNSQTVRWEASLLPGITGTGLTLSSSEGVFRSADGRVLGRISTSLSQPIVMPPPTAPTLIARNIASPAAAVSESLVIPHSVVDAALSTGFTSFVYERSFAVGGDTATGTLRLDFTGRIASPFAIERIEMRFLDGTRFKTVPLGGEEYVEADITFRGNGTLKGSWDVAGSTTTAGAAIFTRKEFINEYVSFGRRKIIRSPAIKAEQPGTYIVRLTISEPELNTGDTLQLSFVARATKEATTVELLAPQPFASLTPGTGFSWEAVAGTKNYLLEIFGTPTAEGQDPAAGIVLSGAESRATLSQAAQRNLLPGKSYWWRIVALGPNSVLLGQSPLREFVTPSE